MLCPCRAAAIVEELFPIAEISQPFAHLTGFPGLTPQLCFCCVLSICVLCVYHHRTRRRPPECVVVGSRRNQRNVLLCVRPWLPHFNVRYLPYGRPMHVVCITCSLGSITTTTTALRRRRFSFENVLPEGLFDLFILTVPPLILTDGRAVKKLNEPYACCTRFKHSVALVLVLFHGVSPWPCYYWCNSCVLMVAFLFVSFQVSHPLMRTRSDRPLEQCRWLSSFWRSCSENAMIGVEVFPRRAQNCENCGSSMKTGSEEENRTDLNFSNIDSLCFLGKIGYKNFPVILFKKNHF